MDDFPTRVAAALRGPCAVPEDAVVGVGVSGGVDSVVLLHTLHRLGVAVAVLHVDHGLRPDSAADARFVQTVAGRLGIPAHVRRVQVAPGNRAAEARRARYGALAEMASACGAQAVAVAHTATDQAETLLMALVRGAGLAGLGGMAPRRVLTTMGMGNLPLVRPLLDETRAAIEQQARQHGWPWRDDPSNAGGVRGRLRQSVLPLLEAEGGPDTARRMARAAAAVRAAHPGGLLDAVAGPGATVRLHLGALPEALRHAVWAEALARWHPHVRRTSALVARLDSLLEAPVGRRVAASGVDAQRLADAVWVGAEGAAAPTGV